VKADQQPSLQLVAAAAHWSRQLVQASASQTQPGTGVWLQAVAGTQASVVQALWSSQSSGVPPTHWPPAQRSPVVQALPSSQATALLVWTQVPAVQVSLVQGLWSSQASGAPAQMPAVQASPVEQALPSSHGVPFG
jgi:hypothetical protein